MAKRAVVLAAKQRVAGRGSRLRARLEAALAESALAEGARGGAAGEDGGGPAPAPAPAQQPAPSTPELRAQLRLGEDGWAAGAGFLEQALGSASSEDGENEDGGAEGGSTATAPSAAALPRAALAPRPEPPAAPCTPEPPPPAAAAAIALTADDAHYDGAAFRKRPLARDVGEDGAWDQYEHEASARMYLRHQVTGDCVWVDETTGATSYLT